jgi:hypothetical protein
MTQVSLAQVSLVPSLNEDVHFVLCDFESAGLAYVETDPAEADATTVVQNLLHGQYERPIARHSAECGRRLVARRLTAHRRQGPGCRPSTKAVS